MANLAILSIGNELLDGRTVNTNAAFFAAELRNLGIEVGEVRAISDSPEQIVTTLSELQSYSFVIVTGGLGPTSDDITAQAAARAWNEPVVRNRKAVAVIKRQLRRLRSQWTAAQARQADLPRSARVLDNEFGIAPGFALERGGTRYFFLPGVPRECRPMFTSLIVPELRQKIRRIPKRDTLLWRTFGAREADLFTRVAGLVNTYQKRFGGNFDYSSQLPYPGVDVRVDFWQGRDRRFPSPSRAERQRLERHFAKEFGSCVFARTPQSLADTLVELLRAHSITLSCAESCTGGLVTAALTEVPGASAVLWGGAVSYANAAKEDLLGVPAAVLRRCGAVSREVALAMAEGARRRSGSDFALSITGVAGPGGGSAAKPVGTIYVAVSSAQGSECEHVWIRAGLGDRLQNRAYASHLALDMLRKKIIREAKAARTKKRGN